jgi:hypothetical protein
MSVQIQSIVFWNDWPNSRDAVCDVRAISNQSWVTAEGEFVAAGESRVIGTGVIALLRATIPQIVLPSTSAGLDNQTARWTVTLHRTGKLDVVATILDDFTLPITFEPVATWGEIRRFKYNGSNIIYRDNEGFSRTDTIREINERIPLLSDATQTSRGRVYASAFDVRIYGAVGDGVHDDTSAIRAAIVACGVNGGGTVYFPKGTYRVQPQASGEDCLYVNYDYVRLLGEGGASVISCYIFGGLDPKTHWEVIDGAVWRGRGIVVQSPSGTRKGFRLEGIRLYGNGNHQTDLYPIDGGSSPPLPASTSTGNGWDISHKGVYFEENKNHDDAEIIDCEIDGWRGEAVNYSGAGSGMLRLLIERCRIHNINASIVSVTGNLTVRDSKLYDGENGIENSPYNSIQVITNNHIYDNRHGATLTGNVAGTFISTLIEGNTFRNNPRGAVWLDSYLSQVRVVNNDIVDCGTVVEEGAIRFLNQYGSDPSQILIKDNRILADAITVQQAFYLVGAPTQVIIENNQISRTAAAATAGRWVTKPTRSNLSSGWDITFQNNSINCQLAPDVLSTSTAYKIPLFINNTGLLAVTMIADGTAAFKVLSESMGVLGNSSGYNLIPEIKIDNIKDGQKVVITSASSSAAGYFAKSGTGYLLKAPRFLINAELVLQYKAAQSKWVEISYTPLDKTRLKLTANDVKLSSDNLNTMNPVMQFYGTDELVLTSGSATTFSDWANAPESVPLYVRIGNAETIANSATVILTGGTSFNPGGAGGQIIFIRPAGSTKIVEISRIAY